MPACNRFIADILIGWPRQQRSTARSRVHHLPPAVDGDDDFVGIGGPDKGLWLLVRPGKEASDDGLEIEMERKTPRLRRLGGAWRSSLRRRRAKGTIFRLLRYV